jgi:hypothetical protein
MRRFVPSTSSLGFVMLDKDPLWFPSRHSFPFDPGIPNKQLWAIGMIVTQWSALEWLIDTDMNSLIANDEALKAEYKKLRNFQQTLAFWQTIVETRAPEPSRSVVLAMIPRIKDLSGQRDVVVHSLWGGGAEGESPAMEGLETTDAAIMPNPGTPIKGKPGNIPPRWRATFIRLRQLAREIATLNRDLMIALMPPGALQQTPQPQGPSAIS